MKSKILDARHWWDPVAASGARVLALAVGLAMVSAIFRIVALSGSATPLGACDTRGFGLDVLVAAALAPCIVVLGVSGGRWGRVLRTLTVVLFSLAARLAYEHVRVLGGWPRPQSLGLALDSTFLNALWAGVGIEVVVLIGLASAMDLILDKVPAAGGAAARMSWRLLCGFAAAASVAVVAVDHEAGGCAGWRAGHFLLPGSLATTTAEPSPSAIGLSRLDLAADISGASWLHLPLRAEDGGPPNVILVMLEGLGGAFLPSVATQHGLHSHLQLPEIDAAARESALFSTLIYHQRQTHRGQYGLLCGDLPSFESIARFDAPESWPHECLPRILRRLGWSTTYFQAAPLAYMGKDRALPIAGFEKVLGDELLSGARWRAAWGVDDHQFLQRAREVILEERAKERPSFVALLTVGTHHPYLLPPEPKVQLPAGATAFERSFLHLDHAFGEFWAWMEREGIFRDTLVVVTGDESAGLQQGTDMERDLSQSLGIAFARGPGIPATRITEPVGQNELAISILDAVGRADDGEEAGLTGRSLWRDLRPRALYFGNFHLGRTMRLGEQGDLTICEAADCWDWSIDPQRWFSSMQRAAGGPDAAVVERLSAMVHHAARGLDQSTDTLELLAPGPQPLPASGSRLLAGGRSLWIAPDQHARLQVELRTHGTSGWIHPRVRFADGLGTAAGAPIELPSLGPGARVGLVAVLGVSTGATGSRADATIKVDRLVPGDLELEIEVARVGVLDGVVAPGLTIRELDVQRPGNPPVLVHTALDLRPEQLDSCLKLEGGVIRGTCPAGLLLDGPTFYAPARSRITARVDVAGEGRASLLVGSGRSGVVALSSGVVSVGGRRTVSLTAAGVLDAQFSELQLGLLWQPNRAGEAALEVTGLEVRVEPP